MNLSIWIVAHYLILHYNDINEQLQKAKFQIADLEKWFLDTLDVFPTGIAIYTKQKGIQYINKSWEKTQSSIHYDSDIKLMKEFGKYLEIKSHEPNFQRNRKQKDEVNFKATRSFEMVKMKADNSITLNDNIVRAYDMIFEKKFDQESGKNLLDSQMHEYEIWEDSSQVAKEFDIRFISVNIPQYKNAMMIVINDIGEAIKHRSSKISENIKTIMFCSLSHELRSPLNHINGVFSLMKDSFETPQQQYLVTIANSSIELLRLKIDDLLCFYEIETDKFNVDYTKFDIRSQWKELESLFLPLIDRNLIRLCFFVHRDTPKYLVHDAKSIHQILVNLIWNSVKYTKSGVISIVVDWIPDQKDNESQSGWIKYSISDSGRGIHKDKKKNIFKFLNSASEHDQYSHQNSTTTALAGTGLSISQKIAEKLQSKIEFVSSEGIGSKFWFEVKIQEHETPPCEQWVRSAWKKFETSRYQRSNSFTETEWKEIAKITKKRRQSLEKIMQSEEYERVRDKDLQEVANSSNHENSLHSIEEGSVSKSIISKNERKIAFKNNRLCSIPEDEDYEESEIDFIIPNENQRTHFVRKFDISASNK